MMNLQRISLATGYTLDECRQHRIDYLRTHIKGLADDVVWLANDTGILSPAFCRCVFEQLLVEAKELRYLVRLSKGHRPPPNEITDEMIEQARSFPIEQVVEFDRQGKALAFCHTDRRPSLSWFRPRNRATCFPCGRSFNSIDVLMERDGLQFPDAVRRLAA